MSLDLVARLGDTEVTDEQRDRIEAAAGAIADRYPDPDASNEREAALNAAVQVILGDATAAEFTTAHQLAKSREVEAHAARTGAIIATAQVERKIDLHRTLGLSRPTINKALGARG